MSSIRGELGGGAIRFIIGDDVFIDPGSNVCALPLTAWEPFCEVAPDGSQIPLPPVLSPTITSLEYAPLSVGATPGAATLPEPSPMLLMALGLAGLLIAGRKR